MANATCARGEGAFTLVELLVVVLIIGVLAAIAVPQYVRAVEKSRSAEAIAWLTTLKNAQEGYLSRMGQYATHVTLLNANTASMRFFVDPSAVASAGVISVAPLSVNPPTWQFSLYRVGTPAFYGNYQFNFTGPSGSISCNSTLCAHDLLP